jgi:hypothetical protein
VKGPKEGAGLGKSMKFSKFLSFSFLIPRIYFETNFENGFGKLYFLELFPLDFSHLY